VRQDGGVKILDIVPLPTGVGVGTGFEVTIIDGPRVVELLIEESVGVTDRFDDLAIFTHAAWNPT